MQDITPDIISEIYRPRITTSHKGDHGHALLIAGSALRAGAAVIAAKACLRSGAGLVTVNIPSRERSILQTAVPEAMLQAREKEISLAAFSCAGIGPAIGTEDASIQMLTKIIRKIKIPLLLDADALTILSKNKKLFDKIPAGTIITPHPKEFDRLFGAHSSDEERRHTAVNLAREKNIIIVLKGHQTMITNGTDSFLNNTGNAGLAKGGSGDALTGIITALLADKYEPLHASILGVYLHGLAADLTLESQSMESMVISDVIENLGKAFKKISASSEHKQ